MAVWQRESDSCIGRGFDAAGFLGKFKSWVVRAPAAVAGGGPAWFIITDKSAELLNPYIVVCNLATPNFNTDRAKFFRVELPTATAGVIQVYNYLWWDSVTNTGSTPFLIARITTLDASSFAYDFRGGANGICIASRIGSTWSRCYLGTWTGDNNQLDPISVNGTLSGGTFVESGDSGNQLGGYEAMTGVRNTNTEAGTGKLYFSLVNTTGSTYRIDVHKDALRTQLVADTGTFTNTATGSKPLTTRNSSGVGGSITLTATATPTTSIDCVFNRIPLGAGEGALFTQDHWCFIYGFTGNRQLCSFVKIVSITGDVLMVDHVGAKVFASGDVINPYPFRVFGFATSPIDSGGTGLSGPSFFLPLQGVQGGEIIALNGSSGSGQGPFAAIDTLFNLLNQVDPGDDQLYDVMQPVIYEQKTANSGFTNNGNAGYGVTDDLWTSSTAGMAEMQDGRRIGSVDYLYCGNYNGIALLIRDTISAA